MRTIEPGRIAARTRAAMTWKSPEIESPESIDHWPSTIPRRRASRVMAGVEEPYGGRKRRIAWPAARAAAICPAAISWRAAAAGSPGRNGCVFVWSPSAP